MCGIIERVVANLNMDNHKREHEVTNFNFILINNINCSYGLWMIWTNQCILKLIVVVVKFVIVVMKL